jgi:hypothetical protein
MRISLLSEQIANSALNAAGRNFNVAIDAVKIALIMLEGGKREIVLDAKALDIDTVNADTVSEAISKVPQPGVEPGDDAHFKSAESANSSTEVNQLEAEIVSQSQGTPGEI